jgi:hypothetical protein
VCRAITRGAVDFAPPVAEKHHHGGAGSAQHLLPDATAEPWPRRKTHGGKTEAVDSISGLDYPSPVLWCNWLPRQSRYCALAFLRPSLLGPKRGKG